MRNKEVKKALFAELCKVGFKKNSGNEIIRKSGDLYQLVYFRKSSYSDDFYISLCLFIPEINPDEINFDNCDYCKQHIIGLVRCSSMNDVAIKELSGKILKLLEKEFNREKIEEIIKAARDGDFEEYYFNTGLTFRKYLGIDE